MSDYKFDPDALRKKLAAESGITVEPLDGAKAEETSEEVPKPPSHADIFKGFAEAGVEDAKPHKEQNLLPVVGGILGGAAQYKGAGARLFRPEPTLFSPRPIPAPEITAPAQAAPMSDVEHTMQSGQGARPSETGRQRESAHNWETNRQKLAQEETLNTPGAKRVIVETGPMYPTRSGIAVPQNVAVNMDEELRMRNAATDLERQRLLEQYQASEAQRMSRAQRNAQLSGAARGVGRVAQGVIGGATAAPQLYEYAKDVVNNKPTDQTQLLSGIGGLMMALGKGRTGFVGGLAQLPYAIKHRKELTENLRMGDIVSDTARMFMTPEELNAPADAPLSSRGAATNVP